MMHHQKDNSFVGEPVNLAGIISTISLNVEGEGDAKCILSLLLPLLSLSSGLSGLELDF